MAKKKDSKVSISSVDKILKANEAAFSVVTKKVAIGDETLVFEVKRVLTFAEFTDMVQSAANAVFLRDPETGIEVYSPECEDVAKFAAMLIYVANFKSEMSIERMYDLLYMTSVEECINQVWNERQHMEFVDAFEKIVKMRRDTIVASEQANLMRIADQLDKAANIMNTMTASFGEMDPETVQRAMSSLANMDEQKLVDAVIDRQDQAFWSKDEN